MASGKEWVFLVISEAAFYFFIFYTLFALGSQLNLWAASLWIWLLINISILFCPVVRHCFKLEEFMKNK